MLLRTTPNSLDRREIDEFLKPEKAPFTGERDKLVLSLSSPASLPEKDVLLLDGIWSMVQSSDGIFADFTDAIDASVPGSVHCALIAAGRLLDGDGNPIDDPYYAVNDQYARAAGVVDYSFETYFELSAADAGKKLRLSFEGVCERCRVWLNGTELGSHTGMFGGPDFDVTGIVREGNNRLVVLLYGAPDRPRKPGELPTFFGGGNPWLNLGWLDTAAFNCTYGWHYADIPGLGIWRSVKLVTVPEVEFDSPFITTLSTAGDMALSCDLNAEKAADAVIEATVSPYNFKGESYGFRLPVALSAGKNNASVDFTIPDARLWHLNGMGEQNLYTLSLAVSVNDTVLDTYTCRFGIRTVEMAPVMTAEGESAESPDRYNWTFVVNGEPTFMKGTGWCTMDALMRFTRDRYEKFLGAAKRQNVNIVRAWGGGLVETEDFYDLCDEYGIAVFQEWPTAWDSYVYQPLDVLCETVERGTKRLRNRASLFIWCGGNEGRASLTDSDPAFDPTNLNTLGRLTFENDGTRPWHRQEPYAGSLHDYIASWGRQNPQKSMILEATFFGEFGMDCWPCMESVEKFTPKEELAELAAKPAEGWDIPGDSALGHHTPMFNKSDDVARVQCHVEEFLPRTSVKNCVIASQLAQVVTVRHTLERARTRFPLCTGSIMYKLNDPYPAASWSTVDWYGTQKPASFFVADSFRPLAAVCVFDLLNYYGTGMNAPVVLLNDAAEAADTVRVKVFNGKLEKIYENVFDVTGMTGKVNRLGTLSLTAEQTKTAPLFVVSEVYSAGALVARNWYFLNYEHRQGCLFDLPKAKLSYTVEGNRVIITNTGSLPAVCVSIHAPRVSETFRPDDGCLWLEPGETAAVSCNFTAGISGLEGWNI